MKYVAYYRVSTRKQSLGLEAQRSAVLNYISSSDTNVLLAEYSEKESGKNDYREQLYNAIECCRKNNAKLLLAKIDRLSRKVGFIFSLRDSGVDFVALDIPNFNTLSLGIFSTLAQTERELISSRTKNALQELKSKGIKLGNPNAHFTDEMRAKAYMANSAIAQRNKNNKRAVSMILSLLNQTNNNSEIARYLNENGFLTSKGKLFTSTQVIRLINRYNLKEKQ